MCNFLRGKVASNCCVLGALHAVCEVVDGVMAKQLMTHLNNMALFYSCRLYLGIITLLRLHADIS